MRPEDEPGGQARGAGCSRAHHGREGPAGRSGRRRECDRRGADDPVPEGGLRNQSPHPRAGVRALAARASKGERECAMSDTSCANQTAHRGVSDYVRRARSVTDRLHRFAFEVNEEVRALSRNRRIECAIPKGSANGWPERDRFLELLSPTARSRAVVVLPSPLRAAFTFRVVAASERRAARIEAERKARAFRRRALRWFGVELEPGRAQELPAEPEPAPWPPDGSDLGHLAALPAPRVPNAELEWRICEAPALLGCRGAGGFERGSAN